jgi:hypothetical protein
MARVRACCTAHAPVGCAVTPARCSLRVPCPVNTSTYNRLGSTLVRDPEFQDHVVAETRALLLTVSA